MTLSKWSDFIAGSFGVGTDLDAVPIGIRRYVGKSLATTLNSSSSSLLISRSASMYINVILPLNLGEDFSNSARVSLNVGLVLFMNKIKWARMSRISMLNMTLALYKKNSILLELGHLFKNIY